MSLRLKYEIGCVYVIVMRSIFALMMIEKHLMSGWWENTNTGHCVLCHPKFQATCTPHSETFDLIKCVPGIK